MSDIDELVARATRGHAAVRRLELDERLARAEASRDALRAAGDEIVATACAETGTTEAFARRECDSALGFAEVIPALAEAIRPTQVPARAGHTRLLWEPYGVVFGWHAANSPIWVPTLVALSALVGGNSVVGRPSRRAARTTGLVMTALASAWPEDAVVIADVAPADGDALVTHRGIHAVIAHASTETCRRHLRLLADAYGEGAPLRPYIPEASGNDAAIILPGADLDATARAVALGGFANAGQLCMAAKRIIVDRRAWDTVVPRLVEAIAQIDADPTYHTHVQTDTSAGRQALAAIADAAACGGRFLVGVTPSHDRVAATLIHIDAEECLGADMWVNEIFAPVRCVVCAEDVEHAVALANASRYGLGAAIFGGSPAERELLTRGVRAARVVVDEGPLYQDPHLVVGGVGDSGYAGARPKIEQLVWAKRVHTAAVPQGAG